MKKVFRHLIAALGLCSALLVAQDTASITGTVSDPTGAAVPNAQVSVTSAERGEWLPGLDPPSPEALVSSTEVRIARRDDLAPAMGSLQAGRS
jgi:hypothetical protein